MLEAVWEQIPDTCPVRYQGRAENAVTREDLYPIKVWLAACKKNCHKEVAQSKRPKNRFSGWKLSKKYYRLRVREGALNDNWKQWNIYMAYDTD